MDDSTIDEMLKQAKMHPFKVRLEFNRRFRVWQDIIHRNRRLHLLAAATPEELRSLHGRYKALDIADAARLSRRADKEYKYQIEGREYHSFEAIGFQMVWISRFAAIDAELEYQLSSYERIVDERIIQRSEVRLQEHKQLREADNGKEN
jgi:hypothetical protein